MQLCCSQQGKTVGVNWVFFFIVCRSEGMNEWIRGMCDICLCLHLMALTTEPRSPFFCLSIYLLIYPSIFFQRYLNLYVMNHSIMAHHVCLFPSSLLYFRRVEPLPRSMPTLPFSPNFSLVITLFPDLFSLSLSIYQSCLIRLSFLLSNNLSFLLHLLYFSFSPPFLTFSSK